MRPLAIFEPEDGPDREAGTLVVGDRDRPDDAVTIGPMTLEEAEQFADRHGLEFELLR
jgi:hypothetical protein